MCGIEVEDCRVVLIRAATVRERLPHTAIKLRIVRLEHSHGVTLLGNDILNRRRDILGFPQP